MLQLFWKQVTVQCLAKDQAIGSNPAPRIDRYSYLTMKISSILRVFGSDDCDRCKVYLPALEEANIEFVFIDAEAEDNDDLCEEYEIDELPVTQVVVDGEVVGELIGPIQPEFLLIWQKELNCGKK